MKQEYDFSQGERGKFYHPNLEIHLPVYLEPEIAEFMRALSLKKQVDIGDLVNDWLKKDIALIQTVQ